MKVVLKRVLLSVVAVAAVAYAVDYGQLRYRVARNRQPYGMVTIQIMYAISEKSRPGTTRTEYQPGGTLDETCVNALFPHFGYSPCWYLRHQTEKRINI